MWQDNNGNLTNGAIANLVDEVGGAVVHVEGLPMQVSVDMSIAFVSTAKVHVRRTILLLSLSYVLNDIGI